MGLTPSKQATLDRLNESARLAHEAAKEKAERAGRASPEAPVPLEPGQLEYPKWLYKGWKPSGKAEGHFEAAESKLVKSKEEHEGLGAGWTESPTKAEAPAATKPEPKPEPKAEAKVEWKKEAPKKE